MDILTGDFFFDLKNFSHKVLFDKDQYVWEVLDVIKKYCDNFEYRKLEGIVSPKAYLVNEDKITLGKGSIIEEGAYVSGPCIIGENCIVRHGAYVRGYVITGNNCVIGHTTEVKNSIFLDDAKAGHFAYIGDSILGNNVNLGAGVKLANLRLNKDEIKIKLDGYVFNTGLRKFGAIIGDGCQLGCNSVANPGTLLGKNNITYPCSNFGGSIF